MEKYDDTRQQLISEVLALTSVTRDSDVAARAMSAWERLAANLHPLIGEAGYCALYARAVHLTAANGGWQQDNDETRSISALFAQLRVELTSIDPVLACKANAAVLETFTRLLSGLIGEALTTRLMNTAWAERPEGNSK